MTTLFISNPDLIVATVQVSSQLKVSYSRKSNTAHEPNLLIKKKMLNIVHPLFPFNTEGGKYENLQNQKAFYCMFHHLWTKILIENKKVPVSNVYYI